MILSGLCSVTFRQNTMGEVVSLAVQAGLRGIEWGGDVHVPHGDLSRAAEARKQCNDAGLVISSYGSYCELIEEADPGCLLDTTAELGAPVIRVWAGSQGSVQASDDDRKRIIERTRQLAEAAAARQIEVAFELHQHTLTDTAESTCSLLEAVARTNVRTYYQQTLGFSDARNLEIFDRLSANLSHLHISYYRSDQQTSLSEGEKLWPRVFAAVDQEDRYALLEFVRDANPQQLMSDAAVLNRWLAGIPG